MGMRGSPRRLRDKGRDRTTVLFKGRHTMSSTSNGRLSSDMTREVDLQAAGTKLDEGD